MEYLHGLDFDMLVDEHGPVPVQRAVHLLTQACESLADAHEHGLIHRDIKPANIFATQMGITHDFVKVLDFGLVKETERDEAATILTQQGMTSGTPAFMPPEIALADPDVDGRADIYALGAVGYWLATGQYVFESDSPVQMVVDHVKTDPPAPSARTELPIPKQFDDVILRTLAKDPAARFQSMLELADALSEIPLSQAWSNRDAEDWWRLPSFGSFARRLPRSARRLPCSASASTRSLCATATASGRSTTSERLSATCARRGPSWRPCRRTFAGSWRMHGAAPASASSARGTTRT